MQYTIHAEKPLFDVHNFAAHGHIHPTERLNDASGQENTRMMARDGCLHYVRIYTMHEHIVSQDASGAFRYDYTETDERLDLLVECGLKPILCFGFMPECIAEGYEDRQRHRAWGRQFYPFAPKDYAAWREVCRAYAQHVVDRYGLDEAATWYYECWNEPDGGFLIPEALGQGKAGQEEKYAKYERMYDAFAMGVREVSPRLRVGGPGSNSLEHNFLDYADRLCRHAAEGVNHETGCPGVPFDFLSSHAYAGGTRMLAMGIAPKLDKVIFKIRRAAGVLQKYGLDVPLLLDEWDISARNQWVFYSTLDEEMKVPQKTRLDLRFRDTEYFSAMFAKAIDLVIRGPLAEGVRLEMMGLCMVDPETTFDGQTEFVDARTLVTPAGFKKPVYHVHSFASRLTGKLLDTDGTLPQYAGVVPVRHADGTVRILVYYMKEDFYARIPNERLTLHVDGLEGAYRIRHYRVDHMMSNSFTKWAELGMPNNPNCTEREAINAAGKLTLLYPETTVTLTDGYTEDVILTQNCVSFIELIPAP